jgi:hypothetical protein
MAVSCDPNDLMRAAACFDKCIPPGMQSAVQTYLLAVIAGGSLDPQVLMDAAKCFKCIPPGELAGVQAMLLCNILNAQ